MEEIFPGLNHRILSYIIGFDSLKATSSNGNERSQITSEDIRLRMDGLFEQKEQALHFTREFIALYTNGPAGGGGIRSMLLQICLCIHFIKIINGEFL